GDAEMERVIASLREPLIGRDGEENVGRLARDLEVTEVVVLENTRMIERALDHRLRAGLAIFLQKVAFQTAGIDADAHRAAVILCGLYHLTHPLRRADVARIDPEASSAGLGRLDRTPIMKMDVG